MPNFTLRYARPNEAAIRTLSFEAENFARAMEMVRETDALPESLVVNRGWGGAFSSPEAWISTLAPAAALLALLVRRSMAVQGSAGDVPSSASDWTWIPLVGFMAVIVAVSFVVARRRRADYLRFIRESSLRTLIAAGAESTPPPSTWTRLATVFCLAYAFFLFMTEIATIPPEHANAALSVAALMFTLGLIRASPATRRPFPEDLPTPNAAT